jgi:tRNA A-37 threonylcarbamoyl transferase component Bud32
MPNGSLYLVLRWIEGESLAAHLVHASSEKAAVLLHTVAQQLTELHQQGITHGDLHLNNILLGHDGKLWFTDFRPAAQLSAAKDLPQRIQADWDAFARMQS